MARTLGPDRADAAAPFISHMRVDSSTLQTAQQQGVAVLLHYLPVNLLAQSVHLIGSQSDSTAASAQGAWAHGRRLCIREPASVGAGEWEQELGVGEA